jgi:hypothetical protein
MWMTRMHGWISCEVDVVGLRCSHYCMAYMKKDYIDVKYYDIADGMYKSWG